MNLIAVKFDDAFILQLEPNPTHDWLLTTEQVAEGYGVSVKTIQGHKISHADELLETKHFIIESSRPCNSRSRGDAVKNANLITTQILWTKRGVVRLGFFIRSERAKRFRNFCEDLVVTTLEQPSNPFGDIGFDWKQHGPIRTELLLNMREKYSTRTEPTDPILEKIQIVENMIRQLEQIRTYLQSMPVSSFPSLADDLDGLLYDWVYSSGTDAGVLEYTKRFGVKKTAVLPVVRYQESATWLLERVVKSLAKPGKPVFTE
jgi:hypothetical protein